MHLNRRQLAFRHQLPLMTRMAGLPTALAATRPLFGARGGRRRVRRGRTRRVLRALFHLRLQLLDLRLQCHHLAAQQYDLLFQDLQVGLDFRWQALTHVLWQWRLFRHCYSLSISRRLSSPPERLPSSDPKAAFHFMEASYLGTIHRSRGIAGLVKRWLGNSSHLWMWDFDSIVGELEQAGFRQDPTCYFRRLSRGKICRCRGRRALDRVSWCRVS